MSPGGTLLSHDDAIRVEYPGVADLLDAFAEVIDTGAYERVAEGRIVLADAAERRARAARLDARPLEITNDPSGWPEHWLDSAGLDLADRAPLGATHTIAELLRAGAEGPVEGRIAATVVRLVSPGDGYLVLVDDGSDAIDVWCPVDAMRWGLSHGRRYELAVRLEPAATARASAVRPLDR